VESTKRNILLNLAKRFFEDDEDEEIEETVFEDEEVVRIYLPNRTFRCLLIRDNDTSKDVIDKVNLKCGFIFSENDYKLYFRYNNKGKKNFNFVSTFFSIFFLKKKKY
jgi:hypothetical protein